MERYMRMKKEELAALAKEAGVRGRGRMTKEQLARALAELSEAVEPGEAPPGASAPPQRDEPAPMPSPAPAPDLPRYLGENRLCLLPQEPLTAFAYWELGEDLPAELHFRVLSLPDGREMVSGAVGDRLGTYYVHLPVAGMEIEAELGLRGPDGFAALVRSNRVRLPDNAPSEELDTLWMTRHRDYEEIYRLSGGTAGGGPAGGYGAGGPGAPVSSWSGRKERGRS